MDAMLILGQIMLLNIVLSADNALVIALASRRLPVEQRRLAVWLGTLLGIILRIGFTFLTVQLLKWPLVQVIGAVMLLWIAFHLWRDRPTQAHVAQASHLGGAIWLILSADLIMSLDNVLAIAAVAEQQWIYILLGVGMSIPLMVWGSQLFMRLLEAYPVLNKVGAAILVYTAVEMLFAGFK